MTINGIIEELDTERAGGPLAVDANAGDSLLRLETVLDFITPTGSGTAVIEVENETDDNTINVSYTHVDEMEQVLHLSAPLPVSVVEGTDVYVTPTRTELVAQVVTEPDTDAVPCVVPLSLRADRALYVGVRVLADIVAGRWTIIDVPQHDSQLDGSKIDPETTVPPAALTDGFPPANAPAPTARDFAVGAIEVTWPAVVNADLVTYDVWASIGTVPDTSGEPLLSTPALRTVISRLGDTRVPLDGTEVFVVVRARDADGDGPNSPVVSAAAIPADNEFISAMFAYFGEIDATQIVGGSIEAVVAILGEIILAGGLISLKPPTLSEDGQPDGGFVILDPANPTGEPLVRLHPAGCTFRGRIVTDILTVLQDAIVALKMTVAAGAEVLVESSIPDPANGQNVLTTGPRDLIADWPEVPSGWAERGIFWDATDNTWLRLIVSTSASNKDGNARVTRISEYGVVLGNTTLNSTPNGTVLQFASIAKIGTSYYTTFRRSDSPSRWIVGRYSTSTGASQNRAFLHPAASEETESVPSVFVHDGALHVAQVTSYDGSALLNVDAFTTALTVTGRFMTNAPDVSDGAITGVATINGVAAEYSGQSRLVLCFKTIVFVTPMLTPGDFGGVTEVDWTPDWQLPTSTWAGGFAYKSSSADGWHTGFVSHSSSQPLKLWAGSTLHDSFGANDLFQVKFAWEDSDEHTAAQVLPDVFVIPRRHFFTITAPPFPSSATTARFWWRIDTTNGSKPWKVRAVTTSAPAFTVSGAETGPTGTPHATNTFGGNPGLVRSQATNGWRLWGDGKAEGRDPIMPLDFATKRYVDEKAARRIGHFTMAANTGGRAQRVDFATPFPTGVVPIVMVSYDSTATTGITRYCYSGGEDNTGFTAVSNRVGGAADPALPMKYVAFTA